MFFVARPFVSNLDLPFVWTPVAFDDHLSPGAIVATVNSFSALVATRQSTRRKR